jgi:hypothetical protein
MNRLLGIQIAAAALIAGAVTAGSQLLWPAAPTACDPTRDMFIVRHAWLEMSQHGGTITDDHVFSKFDRNAPRAEVELGGISAYRLLSHDYDPAGRFFLLPFLSYRGPPARPAPPQDTLYEYSICTGRLQPVLTLPEGSRRRINSARYARDGVTVLAATSEGFEKSSVQHLRLEVYRGGARILEATVSGQTPVPNILSIDGVTSDGGVAYMTEFGTTGDDLRAFYRWERNTNAVTKLGDADFPFGVMNLAATHTIRFRRNHQQDDLEWSDEDRRCIKEAMFRSGKYKDAGIEIVWRELTTGRERVLHRHPEGPGRCLQETGSLRWFDDRTIVFSLSDGIFALDPSTGSPRLLAPGNQPTDPDPTTFLVGSNDEYVVTTRKSVVHVKTGKEIPVPAIGPIYGGRLFARLYR